MSASLRVMRWSVTLNGGGICFLTLPMKTASGQRQSAIAGFGPTGVQLGPQGMFLSCVS